MLSPEIGTMALDVGLLENRTSLDIAQNELPSGLTNGRARSIVELNNLERDSYSKVIAFEIIKLPKEQLSEMSRENPSSLLLSRYMDSYSYNLAERSYCKTTGESPSNTLGSENEVFLVRPMSVDDAAKAAEAHISKPILTQEQFKDILAHRKAARGY